MSDLQAAEARLIISASEVDADLYYATKFLAPDPFIFIETEAEKLLLVSDLELDRARAVARVDRVLSLTRYLDRARPSESAEPTPFTALDALLQELHVRSLLVPRTFSIEATDYLRNAEYDVRFTPGPFFPERECKTTEEIQHIRQVQQHTEAAMEVAIAAIEEADVRDGMLYRNGALLTSEEIKRLIALTLLERECTARYTIVACGDQACDPHNQGSGPLQAGLPIIIDIFPRSDHTGYFGDLTRTVGKGPIQEDAKTLYDVVLEGQNLALDSIRAGVNGREIHRAVMDLFKGRGFRTGELEGRMQGFFHGTGHGVGLEIHEPPRISKADTELQSGHVVTVEPGLYYISRGAVRIEDLVVVTDSGCENLTTYPKQLEV